MFPFINLSSLKTNQLKFIHKVWDSKRQTKIDFWTVRLFHSRVIPLVLPKILWVSIQLIKFSFNNSFEIYLRNVFDNNTQVKFNLVIIPIMVTELCPCLLQLEVGHLCSMDVFLFFVYTISYLYFLYTLFHTFMNEFSDNDSAVIFLNIYATYDITIHILKCSNSQHLYIKNWTLLQFDNYNDIHSKTI